MKKLVMVVTLIVSALLLVACDQEGSNTALKDSINKLEMGYAVGDNSSSVTKDLILPTSSLEGATLTWESSNEAIVSTTGKVVRPTDKDTQVTLTAHLTKDSKTESRPFTVTVIKEVVVNELKIAIDTLKLVFANGDHDNSVTKDLVLPASPLEGATLTWESSNAAVISITGKVVRPTDKDTQVVLTAKLSKDAKQESKQFTVTVLKAEVVLPTELEATLQYTGDATGNMDETGNNAAIVGLDALIFSVTQQTSVSGSYSNVVGLNKVGGIRLYSNKENGKGNILTVSVGDGYTIKAITITFGASTKPASASITLGSMVVPISDTVSQVYTKTDLDLASFSIQNTNTGVTGQVWIQSIEITYVAK